MQTMQQQTPIPSPKRPRKKWLPYAIIGAAAAFGVLMMLTVFAVIAFAYVANRIPDGVTVAGVNFGGLSPDAAEARIATLAPSSNLILTDREQQWQLAYSDLGISVDRKAMLEELKQSPAHSALPLRYQIDLNQAQNGLLYLSDLVNIPADSGKGGRAMDIPVTLSRLNADLNGEVSDGIVELDMLDTLPLVPVAGEAYSGTTTKHMVEAGQELALIAKMYNVAMEDIVTLNAIENPDLLYVGQELLIPAAGIYEPTADTAPLAPLPTGKSILVSLTDQRIYAYENGSLVRSHLVSTGLPATPTVMGDYAIQRKYVADDMSGPGYFLPQVPSVMYFYAGYAIHGTYWHNAFGRPMSHGCVNLPPDEAQWFFNWAEMGTMVRVVA